MNLRTFLVTVRLYWKTFLVVTVVVFAGGMALLLLRPVQYVSNMQLMVSIQGSTTAAAYQNDTVVAGRVNSYIALLASDVVSQRVIDKLGLPLTAQQLAAKISATNVPPNTSIIDVAVTDRSADQARRIADAVATEFISFTDALETPTGEDGQKIHTTIVSAASQPKSRPVERVLLGVLVALTALIVGAVAVWIRSVTDRVIRTAYQAAAAVRVPVLGTVNAAAAASIGDLDGYRRLRARLRSISGPSGGSVLEMTSADGEIDVAIIATNLGRVMALAGGRAVVINAVASEKSTSEVVPGADGFPDTLTADAASGLIDRLRGDYEKLIIAAPATLRNPTASVVGEYADTVLLMVSEGHTKRRNASRAAASLVATGAPLIGAVLVDHDHNFSKTRSSAIR